MISVPGLAIVREDCARECWAIVHVPAPRTIPDPDDRAVILDLAGQATAELAAEELEPLIDWTLSPSELASAADLLVYVEAAIERVAARYGGTTLGGQAVYAW